MHRRRSSTICCSSAWTLLCRERHSSSACSRSTFASASITSLDTRGRDAPAAIAPCALDFPLVLSERTGRDTPAVSVLDLAAFSLPAADAPTLGAARALARLLSAQLVLDAARPPGPAGKRTRERVALNGQVRNTSAGHAAGRGAEPEAGRRWNSAFAAARGVDARVWMLESRMFEVLSSVRSPSAHAAAPGLGTCQTTRRASAISRGALARRVARNRLLSRAVAGARRSGHVQHNFHQQGGCARGGVTHQGRCRARHHRRRLLQGLPSGHAGDRSKKFNFMKFSRSFVPRTRHAWVPARRLRDWQKQASGSRTWSHAEVCGLGG